MSKSTESSARSLSSFERSPVTMPCPLVNCSAAADQRSSRSRICVCWLTIRLTVLTDTFSAAAKSVGDSPADTRSATNFRAADGTLIRQSYTVDTLFARTLCPFACPSHFAIVGRLTPSCLAISAWVQPSDLSSLAIGRQTSRICSADRLRRPRLQRTTNAFFRASDQSPEPFTIFTGADLSMEYRLCPSRISSASESRTESWTPPSVLIRDRRPSNSSAESGGSNSLKGVRTQVRDFRDLDVVFTKLAHR